MPSNLVYHMGLESALRTRAGSAPPVRKVAPQRFVATSLLLTMYGDALAPRGPAPIPLAAMIAVAQSLGLSARHVRTSVQRLSQADWLQAQRVGRCSFYTCASIGQRRITLGEQRIFPAPVASPPELGRWSFLVMGPHLRASTRGNLSRELAWCGFGEIAPGVFAQHGAAPAVDLLLLLDAHHARDQVWTLLNVPQDQEPQRPDARVLCPQGHCAQRLLQGWRDFAQQHHGIPALVPTLGPAQAFAARTQLVHGYRRQLQNHPELPFANCAEMQDARQHAQRVFAKGYLALLEVSERFLDRYLPPPSPQGQQLLHQRVGALRTMLAH